MNRNPLTLAIALILLLVFGLLLFAFQVRTTEVAVVTTFGRPTRPISEPGLYGKMPWPVQKVYKFDKRIHNFESKFEQVLTSDGYNLLVMVYIGWRIEEPDRFFPRFGGSTARAEESLQGLVRNAYSGVVGRHPFSEFISTDAKQLKFVEIEREMLQRVQADVRTNSYGLEVRFLGIKKLGLPESVTELVFQRMQSERALKEGKIRDEGLRESEDIRSRANLESAKMLAQADSEATRIRALGQSKAAESLKIFEQDPVLANFLQKLDALESLLKERATLLLDDATSPLDLLKMTLPGALPPPSRAEAHPQNPPLSVAPQTAGTNTLSKTSE
jgi:membrane protease subunit HflC